MSDRTRYQERRLREAASANDLAGLRRVLRHGGVDVDAPDDEGNTALAHAAHDDRVAVIDALLAAGAQVNRCNRGGQSPLMIAVRHNAEGAVRRLLAAGADLGLRNRSGSVALHLIDQRTSEGVISALLSRADCDVNVRDKVEWTPLIIAAQKGAARILPLLIEAGADLSARDIIGQDALFWAQRGEHAAVAQYLSALQARAGLVLPDGEAEPDDTGARPGL